jgi:tetratricopeptide (TPR) repeat protein
MQAKKPLVVRNRKGQNIPQTLRMISAMRLLPLLCLLAFGFLLPLAPAQAVLLIEINPGSEPATPEQLVAMKSLQKLYADYWAAQQAAKADGPMDVEQHLAVKNSATSVLDIKENLPGYMVLFNYHSSFYEWNEKTFNPALTLETFKQYESLYRKGIATYKDLPLQEKWADILLSVAWANLMLNNPPDALKYANEAAILRGNVYSALSEADYRLHNPTEKDPKVAAIGRKVSEMGRNVAEQGRACRLIAQALVQTDKIRDARTILNHERYRVIRLVLYLTGLKNDTEISDDTKIMIEATLAGMDNQQGLIELQLGNLAEAQKWFRQAWQRTRPDNAPAHALIAA